MVLKLRVGGGEWYSCGVEEASRKDGVAVAAMLTVAGVQLTAIGSGTGDGSGIAVGTLTSC